MKYKYPLLLFIVIISFSSCVFLKNTSQKIKTTFTNVIHKLDKKKNKVDTASSTIPLIADTLSLVKTEIVQPKQVDSAVEIKVAEAKAVEVIDKPIVNPTLLEPSSEKLAHPLREFRAAWVASVGNINWPSKPGLTSDEQKAEALNILNYLQQNNFNAVIFQIRPQADALYASEIEPWSYFLTGLQDKAPEPFYDPLAFWIEEAHNRGIELHAWMNPYRAHTPIGKDISDKSIVRTNPEAVHYLKDGYWWMDPSLPFTQDHTSKVVMDVVKRYDVDGIHFDDYFYPYPSYNGGIDFPDHDSWNAYLEKGGKLSRGDWRRDAVNTLIERLYKEIKKEKPHVKFGLSPFGIWRPGHPRSVVGFDQYDKLYADAKLWLNKGWIDYFAPQLYWPTKNINLSFPVLLAWWQEENTHQRHLWPGINIENDKNPIISDHEVVSQIMITRGILSKSPGTVHWNLGSLTKNASLTKDLKSGVYKEPALVPASPWLDHTAPKVPEVLLGEQPDSLLIKWSTKDHNIVKWVVYYKYDNKWEHKIFNKTETETYLKTYNEKKPTPSRLKQIIVTAIDRTGNESAQKPIDIN